MIIDYDIQLEKEQRLSKSTFYSDPVTRIGDEEIKSTETSHHEGDDCRDLAVTFSSHTTQSPATEHDTIVILCTFTCHLSSFILRF